MSSFLLLGLGLFPALVSDDVVSSPLLASYVAGLTLCRWTLMCSALPLRFLAQPDGSASDSGY
jgi:hypothetical protein